MTPRSLGYATDLRILRASGSQVRRGAAWTVVQTPDQPTFRWGNMVVFDEAPAPGCAARWRQIFEAEVAAGRPEVDHLTYGWDDPRGPVGAVDELVAAGFVVDHNVVLRAKAPAEPTHLRGDLVVRPHQRDADWDAALALQSLDIPPEEEPEGYLAFTRGYMAGQRALAEGGAGHRFGAWLGDTLVGELGLYTLGGLGRFQSVMTHPDHRRAGVARTLVWHTSRWGLGPGGAHTLVIVAEDGAPAVSVYQAVGYEAVERQASAMWWPHLDTVRSSP